MHCNEYERFNLLNFLLFEFEADGNKILVISADL